MLSGSLAPSGQSSDTVSMDVSGYETYAVGFYPVGWVNNNMAIAWSAELTDQTTVTLAIDVMAD